VDAASINAQRIRLGELAAELDDQLTVSLALYYGRELVHVLTLVNDVMWRVPVEARIEQLANALQRTRLHDDVPALTESLTTVFRIRNLLAHSVAYEDQEDALTLYSVRGGKRKTLTLTHAHLAWTVRLAQQCRLKWLPRIEGRIGHLDTWARLYGFQER
jgi:hypothetical protein